MPSLKLAVLPDLPQNIPARLQDLNPKGAHLALRVERQLLEALGGDLSGAGILVGVSGGIDSLTLLITLAALRERAKFTLKACHLNHCLRPEAPAEQAWVAEVCARLGVEFHGRVADVAALAAQSRVGLEEAGRNARLAMFKELAAPDNAFIATGHTLNDLGEDVLMRLLRGSGWPALAGMDRFHPGLRLLRPLLFTPRAELAAFLERLGLPHLEDKSNAEPGFLRNRLRLEVVPLLLRENPGWLEQVRALKCLAEVDTQYWQDETNALPPRIFTEADDKPDLPGLDAEKKALFLAREQLRSAHKALRLRLFMRCVSELGGGQALADNLFALDAAWSEGPGASRNGKIIQLPGDVRALLAREGIWFYFQKRN